MLNFSEKQRLLGLLPDFLLLSGTADAAALKSVGAVTAVSAEDVLATSALGLGRREIFYAPQAGDDLVPLLDKCRLVAASMADMEAINAASAEAGVVTMVGLYMPADGFEGKGITSEELRGMVHDIKQLKNISVCGVIITGNVEGLHGKALGKYVRSSYQTAKVMTYILPCSMPYICIDGFLEAAAWNESEHPEDFQDFLTAANIVGMQNTTAFYADYYVI